MILFRIGLSLHIRLSNTNTRYVVVKKSTQQSNMLLFYSGMSVLLGACSINPNPKESGFIDSLYYLSNNTYQQRNTVKQNTLMHLKHQQQNKKKKLSITNKAVIENQETLKKTAIKLKKINKKQQKEYFSLVKTNAMYASKKRQHSKLIQQKKQLEKGIKKEKYQAKQQENYIHSLQKKRDALRKEILLQTTL